MNGQGFTLLEVVTALSLLGVGVLGTVRAAGALAGLTARSARAGRLAAVAENQLELSRGVGCTGGAGRYVDGPFDVVWSVAASQGVGRVLVRVYWPDRAGMRTDTFVTGFPCP